MDLDKMKLMELRLLQMVKKPVINDAQYLSYIKSARERLSRLVEQEQCSHTVVTERFITPYGFMDTAECSTCKKLLYAKLDK